MSCRFKAQKDSNSGTAARHHSSVGRASVRQAKGHGLNPSECQIFFSAVFFVRCYYGEVLEGPIMTGVCII